MRTLTFEQIEKIEGGMSGVEFWTKVCAWWAVALAACSVDVSCAVYGIYAIAKS